MCFKFYIKFIFSFFLLIGVALSCKKETSLEKHIAEINTQITTERFDRLFASVTTENLPKLKTAYPFMFSKKYKDSFWLAKKEDTLQKQLFNEVAKTFTNFQEIENEIEWLFNHIKYYFLDFNTPRVITITNDVDYRNNVIVTDTIILIALDNYLGSEHPFYTNIPNYLKANFKKSQVVVDLAKAYSEKYIYQPQRRTLLDEMIFYGKQLYFEELTIPFKTEAELIGYSESQLNWAIKNEEYIWRYFVERELLFSTDAKLPSRFINNAPFSKFYLESIDAESPGRIGQYVGWQIVRAYMQNNEATLNDMLKKSTDDIFNNSKFKPRK